MNILWLTPTHSRSAIAHFSDLVIERLATSGAEIVIGSTQVFFDSGDRRPFGDRPLSAARLELEAPDRFDAIIANFGDHYPNHCWALEALRHERVIGIFHDAVMTNFGNGWREAGRWSDLLAAWPEGGNPSPAIAARCAAAVAHSDFYLPALDTCDGPVRRIDLAWEVAGRALPVSAGDPARWRVVTFGNINPNKCPDRIIEAIAMSPLLRERVEYRLVGEISDVMRERLSHLAASTGVRLEIAGRVSDDELVEELAAATIVTCLRDPVFEGASASAIEAMMHGRALIVSDAGFYRGLPDDAVAKVPKRTLPADISPVLEALLTDGDRRIELQGKARSYALTAFSPDLYAQRLLALINDMRIASAWRPLSAGLVADFERWGITSDHPVVELSAQMLEQMIPAARRAPARED